MSRPKVTWPSVADLIGRNDGLTIAEMAAELDWSSGRVSRNIHRLRRWLADSKWNIVAETAGVGQPWRYWAVSDYDEAKPWVIGRLGDAETRFRTLDGVLRSLVNASDARTSEGRRARIMAKATGRMLEDLAELDGRLAV